MALSAQPPSIRSQGKIDRLFIITVMGEQATELRSRLTKEGFQVTEINSAGGLLQEAQISYLLGFHTPRQPQLLAIIREVCKRQRRYLPAHLEGSASLFHAAIIEAEVGGAVVFALDVERFEQL
jgi:uncharacterized protein YaaQ